MAAVLRAKPAAPDAHRLRLLPAGRRCCIRAGLSSPRRNPCASCLMRRRDIAPPRSLRQPPLLRPEPRICNSPAMATSFGDGRHAIRRSAHPWAMARIRPAPDPERYRWRDDWGQDQLQPQGAQRGVQRMPDHQKNYRRPGFCDRWAASPKQRFSIRNTSVSQSLGLPIQLTQNLQAG